MPLLPHAYSIISAVDQIHRICFHRGGRLGLAEVFDRLPGFLLSLASDDELEGLASAVRVEAGCARIAVQESLDPLEMRFVVACEVGRAILHLGHLRRWQLPSSRGLGNGAALRAQAQIFGAELLAPLWALELVATSSGNRDDAHGLAQRLVEVLEIPNRIAEHQARRFFAIRSSLPLYGLMEAAEKPGVFESEKNVNVALTPI